MKPNFQILDNLRGMAALYVVINHARGFLHIGGKQVAQEIPLNEWTLGTKIYYGILQFTALGDELVIFFFVLSGFSIAYSLNQRANIKQFYQRRLIRIYPPYILALLWASWVYFLIFQTIQIPIEAGIGNVLDNFWTVLQNLCFIPTGSLIIPFWSLAYEVIFYVLSPLLLIRCWKVYVSFSILLFLFTTLFIGKESPIYIWAFFQKYSLFFALGIALFFKYPEFDKSLQSSKRYFGILFFVFVFVLVLAKFVLGTFANITQVLSAFFSLYCIVNFQKHSIQFVWLRKLGKMSYTLYITHFASLFLFKYLLFRMGIVEDQAIRIWYVWILAVIFSIILAYILYILLEKRTKLILDSRRK